MSAENDLARVLFDAEMGYLYGEEAPEWSDERWDHQEPLRLARAALAAGYRKVTEDPETVERTAVAAFCCYYGLGEEAWNGMQPSDRCKTAYRELAKDVLRALRGGDSDA